MAGDLSRVPQDFLRAMGDAAEALRELTASAVESVKAKDKETKASERGLRNLRDVASAALPLSVAGIAGAGLRGGVQALATGGSFGQGFTGGVADLARGLTGFNAAGQSAVDQAVGRVQGFVGPLAELGYQFSEDDLRQMVQAEYSFTSRGQDEAEAFKNIRTEMGNASFATDLGGVLDVAADAHRKAAAALGSVKQAIIGDPKFNGPGFKMEGPYPEGGVLDGRGGSPR